MPDDMLTIATCYVFIFFGCVTVIDAAHRKQHRQLDPTQPFYGSVWFTRYLIAFFPIVAGVVILGLLGHIRMQWLMIAGSCYFGIPLIADLVLRVRLLRSQS